MILGVITATIVLVLMWAAYNKGRYDGYNQCIDDVNEELKNFSKQIE